MPSAVEHIHNIQEQQSLQKRIEEEQNKAREKELLKERLSNANEGKRLLEKYGVEEILKDVNQKLLHSRGRILKYTGIYEYDWDEGDTSMCSHMGASIFQLRFSSRPKFEKVISVGSDGKIINASCGEIDIQHTELMAQHFKIPLTNALLTGTIGSYARINIVNFLDSKHRPLDAIVIKNLKDEEIKEDLNRKIAESYLSVIK